MKRDKFNNVKEIEAYVNKTVAISKARRKHREAKAFLEIEKNKSLLGEKFNSLDPYGEEQW